MKRLLLVVSMLLFISQVVSAQNHNTLWCDKNPAKKLTNHVMTQKSSNGVLTFKVKWEGPNGGSTLSKDNLSITNGECDKCTPLGAIGSKNYEQIWTVKVTDVKKPVTLAWKTPGTINYCGEGKLLIPAAVFK